MTPLKQSSLSQFTTTFLAAATLIAAFSTGTAAPATAVATPVVSAPLNAQDQIKKLAAVFGPAWSLTYSERLVVKQYGSTSGAVTHTFTIIGELTKPGMYKYNMGTSGTLTSDGRWNIATDSAKTHYCRYAAPGDFTVGEDWPFVSSHILKGADAFNYAIPSYIFKHVTDVDFVNPESTTLTAANVTYNGKPAVDVDYKSTYSDVHLYLDPLTHMIIGAHSSYTDYYGRVTDAQETFGTMTTVTKQEPAADYSTVPPPGAIAVALPPPPVVKPRTQPKAPKPRTNKTRVYTRPYYVFP